MHTPRAQVRAISGRASATPRLAAALWSVQTVAPGAGLSRRGVHLTPDRTTREGRGGAPTRRRMPLEAVLVRPTLVATCALGRARASECGAARMRGSRRRGERSATRANPQAARARTANVVVLTVTTSAVCWCLRGSPRPDLERPCTHPLVTHRPIARRACAVGAPRPLHHRPFRSVARARCGRARFATGRTRNDDPKRGRTSQAPPQRAPTS